MKTLVRTGRVESDLGISKPSMSTAPHGDTLNRQVVEPPVTLRRFLKLRKRMWQLHLAGASVPFPSTCHKPFRKTVFPKELVVFLEKNYQRDNLTIPTIAKGMHMSESQLRRKVRAFLHTTPQLFLRSFRLRKATQMIRHTNLSIKEIAYQAGFGDPAHFSNVFMREFGKRPSEWR